MYPEDYAPRSVYDDAPRKPWGLVVGGSIVDSADDQDEAEAMCRAARRRGEDARIRRYEYDRDGGGWIDVAMPEDEDPEEEES